MSGLTVLDRVISARDHAQAAATEARTRDAVPVEELVAEFFHRWEAVTAMAQLHLIQQQHIPCGSWPFGEHTVVRFAGGSAMVEPTVSRLVRPVSSYTYNHEARFR